MCLKDDDVGNHGLSHQKLSKGRLITVLCLTVQHLTARAAEAICEATMQIALKIYVVMPVNIGKASAK